MSEAMCSALAIMFSILFSMTTNQKLLSSAQESSMKRARASHSGSLTRFVVTRTNFSLAKLSQARSNRKKVFRSGSRENQAFLMGSNDS